MPANNNFNIEELGAKLQQLQVQVDSFNKMKQQTNALSETTTSMTAPTQPQTQEKPQGLTYPKVWRSDTVEDILNNPQWKQELGAEFAVSEAGLRAKNFTETLFMEFCEKQTGKSSVMLNEIRKNQAAQEAAAKKTTKTTVPKAEDPPVTPVG